MMWTSGMDKRVGFMRQALGFLLGATGILFIFLIDRRNGSSLSAEASLGAFRTLKALEKRPAIYTFQESHAYKDSRLDAWQQAWKIAGWDAKVLYMEDAKNHSEYDIFEHSLSEIMPFGRRQEKNGYYRWLAMATMEEGGWLADVSVFPLWPAIQMDSQVFSLEQFKVHCGTPKKPSNCLSSGNKHEWNRMAQMLLKSVQRHCNQIYRPSSVVGVDAPIPEWTDNFSLQEIVSYANGRPMALRESHVLSTAAALDIIPMDAVETNLGAKQCSQLTDKFAVKFEKVSNLQPSHQIDLPYIQSWISRFKKDCVKTSIIPDLTLKTEQKRKVSSRTD